MAATEQRRVAAAVDVGSNSVHLLVAELVARPPAGRDLVHLHEESVLLGLGNVVDGQGSLPESTRLGVLGTLAELRRVAQVQGASTVTFIGTEPLRRASNAAQMCDEVEGAFGRPLLVLSERAEAQLTYLGVTGARPLRVPLLIVDIGGGSTEVIVARSDHPPEFHSLASGSGRLANGIVLHDPPTPSEFDRLRAGARSLVGSLPPGEASSATFVGGTATNLVRLVPLSAAGLEEAHGLLTSLTVDELVQRYGMNPLRARQMPAGAAIVEALLDHFRPTTVEASQASLRDGAILAADWLGESWPANLDQLVLPEGR